MSEPSIVERNARIIKWLIKCRNLPTCPLTVRPQLPPKSTSIPGSSQIFLLQQQQQQYQQQYQLQQQRSLISSSSATTAVFYGQSTRL